MAQTGERASVSLVVRKECDLRQASDINSCHFQTSHFYPKDVQVLFQEQTTPDRHRQTLKPPRPAGLPSHQESPKTAEQSFPPLVGVAWANELVKAKGWVKTGETHRFLEGFLVVSSGFQSVF